MSASYVLTLDSLEKGLHFADHFAEIAAGDDLRISVTGYCLGSDAVYIPKSKVVEINSLFAGLRGAMEGETKSGWKMAVIFRTFLMKYLDLDMEQTAPMNGNQRFL